MFSLGRLHVITLSATVILAALSVVSGSTLTASAGAALIGAVFVAAPALHAIDRPKRLTRLIHALTLVLLAYAFIAARSSTIDAVLLVVMLGIANRFVLRGGHRDDFLIIGASTVLFAAATTITPGVLFLFVLVAFVPCLLWALWTSMILGAAENGATEPQLVSSRAAAVHAMAQRRAPRMLSVIAGWGLGLLAIGYAAVSVLPRYYFLNFFGAGAFMTLAGSSPTMELRTGGVTDLDSSQVVMRVEPQPGKLAGSLVGLYARTMVMDEFDGKSFSSVSDPAVFPLRLPIDRLREDINESEFEPDDDPETVRVTLNRFHKNSLQHPLVTLGRTAPSEIIKRHVRQNLSGTWIASSFRGSAITYKVRLGKRFDPPNFPRHLVDRQREVLVRVPDDLDPRVAELARRLTEGKETAEEKIDAVLQHFSRGFTYSLERLEGTSDDPLVRFLFEAKAGHCELYAGAVAVLLRVAGVKTRVAAGYYNGKWNDLGGYLAFTQADAHAWVEAYVEGEGWRWIDATPEDMRAIRKRPAFAFLRDWYDAAEAFWFEHVLDFDETKRKLFIDRVAKRFRSVSEGANEIVERGSAAVVSGTTKGVVAAGGFLVLVLAVPAAVIIQLRRRARRRPETIGRRLRAALGEREGENATLGALVARAPDGLRAEAAECVALYEEMRFGPTETAPPVDRVVTAVDALERFIKEQRTRV